MLDRRHYAAGRLIHLIAPLLKSLRHCEQHTWKPRPPMLIPRRKISPPKKWLPIRSKKRSQRPASLSTDRRHRRLIARIHIRPLIAIHLHRNKLIVDNPRGLCALVRLAIHYMAPVAPYRANIQQNRLVFTLRPRERRLAPLLPLNRLMHRRP